MSSPKSLKEITLKELEPKQFIAAKSQEIKNVVGDGLALNALSGGVDSSTVTMLGHRALGERLKTVFIDHGLMREGEPEAVIALFDKLGVKVERIEAKEIFLERLQGLTDPEEKREAITQAFYKDVFGRLVREGKARFLLHGTIYTDIEETIAGVKRQHNILTQLGIDTKVVFGYQILEPLIELRKPAVRKIAQALGLPKEIYNRMPFPGPALAARIIGEVTPERLKIVKKATGIVEDVLKRSGAFQYMAILQPDKVTGVRNGRRDFGWQIEVRSWDSTDAVTAIPTRLSWKIFEKLAKRITKEVPMIVSVSYNITPKPPSTIEAI